MTAGVPSLQKTVSDLILEYETKNAAVDDEIRAFEEATRQLEMSAVVSGHYVGPVISTRSYRSARDLRINLLKSGWRAIFSRLQIDRIASADDKRRFERAIADPPPLTFDNAKATFGDYLVRPRYHILRGLAEAFCALDDAYKSHSKIKIGVAGLPKRVILTGFGDYCFGSYGRDRLRDIINALATYRGQPIMTNAEVASLDEAIRKSAEATIWDRPVKAYVNGRDEEVQFPDRGLRIKRFANGNAHVFFLPDALRAINLGLAEFYGDVLPDVEEDGSVRQASTAVAKDLQFYPTPPAVIDVVVDAAGIHKGRAPLRVLEPSCGDGRIMDAVRRLGHWSLGVEAHAGRTMQARAKGHHVLQANFLDQPPSPDFDRVVMNPPFYGRHYVKHVRHAQKFLKPDGLLVAILPATAWYDHKELSGKWRDLPVGSFAESGTNVPTGYLQMGALR